MDPINVIVSQPSGPGWSFWAILISAIVATLAIATNRVVAKRNSAIQLILLSQQDEFVRQRLAVRRLIESGNVLTVFSPRSPEDFDARRAVSAVLNYHELVAIAVFERSADEKILKLFQRTTMVQTWDGCADLVAKIHEAGDSSVYESYGKLAKRWSDTPEVEQGTWSRIKSVLAELVPW